jgi:hypothetical protein
LSAVAASLASPSWDSSFAIRAFISLSICANCFFTSLSSLIAASLPRGTDTEAGVAEFVLAAGVAAFVAAFAVAAAFAGAEADGVESLPDFAGPVSGPSIAGYSTIA